jgi:hypothetical protein
MFAWDQEPTALRPLAFLPWMDGTSAVQILRLMFVCGRGILINR